MGRACPYAGQLLFRCDEAQRVPRVLLRHVCAGPHQEQGRLIVFAAITAAFIVSMLKAGTTFWEHSYYILPFIPGMALVVGHGLAHLPQRIASIVMVVIAAEGVVNQLNDFRMNPEQAPLLELESDFRNLPDNDARVAINSGNVPTPMYFADRSGWTLFNSDIDEGEELDMLSRAGCAYLVIMMRTYEGEKEVPWPVVVERPAYRIHRSPTFDRP